MYFHDYGYRGEEPSWEKRYYLENFSSWFELAKEESSQFKAEQA